MQATSISRAPPSKDKGAKLGRGGTGAAPSGTATSKVRGEIILPHVAVGTSSANTQAVGASSTSNTPGARQAVKHVQLLSPATAGAVGAVGRGGGVVEVEVADSPPHPAPRDLTGAELLGFERRRLGVSRGREWWAVFRFS